MSLRKRLLVGIVAMLTILWVAAMGWFLVHVRAELRQVLDVRLASSARMVQGLLARGQFELSERGMSCPVISTETGAGVLPSELTCQLWSLEGEVLSTSGDAPPLLIDEPREDGFSNRLVDGEPWRVFTLTDHLSGVRLATAERQALRSELVRDAALAVSLPFVLVLPGMVLLVWVGVGRGLAPLEHLRAAIRRRHADALDALVQTGSPPEVEPLVAALNRLFERLRSSIERERRFNGDAAHELKTPLAGVKTQLQIARAAEGETQARALAQAELGLDRMSRLVEQMLTLARVDSDTSSAARNHRADAASVIDDVERELSFLMRSRGVSLTLSAPSRPTSVAMPIELLHVALRNLVENAIQHSRQGGRVNCDIQAGEDSVVIRILDEGPGIAPEELSAVTQRFHRAGKQGSGSGLGLSIVAAVCERFGARLELANRQDRTGLSARLIIPKAG